MDNKARARLLLIEIAGVDAELKKGSEGSSTYTNNLIVEVFRDAQALAEAVLQDEKDNKAA